MGNSIGRGKKTKVMKIDGEVFKLKTPVQAGDVVKDYPGHMLLESKAVKQFGIRARPLGPEEELEPMRIYFLVELPKKPLPPLPEPETESKSTRRVRSAMHMTAKDRLECMMLSRRTRSASDLSIVRPAGHGPGSGTVRVKMRLPKAQLDKLVEESKDETEVAERIIDLYVQEGRR